MSEEAFIYEAIRTPRGKQKNGSLHEVKPLSLVVGLIDELRKRHPDLDENLISDVILGCVSPVGDQGGDIARAAVLASGMPVTSGGVQLNRFCASGLEAVNTAAQKVRSGWDDLVLAGGVESMSRVPMGSDGGAMGLDPATNYDVMFVPQGIGADLIATIEGFSREDVDAYALRSQQKAAEAWSGGYFAKSVVPVRDQNGLLILDHDEHMRPDTTKEGLAKLKPAFEGLAALGGFDDVALQKYHWVEKINHVHTGGNSSGNRGCGYDRPRRAVWTPPDGAPAGDRGEPARIHCRPASVRRRRGPVADVVGQQAIRTVRGSNRPQPDDRGRGAHPIGGRARDPAGRRGEPAGIAVRSRCRFHAGTGLA